MAEMSIDEIIAKLEEMADDREDKILPGCLGWDEIEPLREAIEKLKTHPEAQPNEPLTLEELRELDGQPVWVKPRNEDDFCAPHGWAIVTAKDDGCVQLDLFDGQQWLLSDDDGEPEDEEDEIGAVYRRPPEEG